MKTRKATVRLITLSLALAGMVSVGAMWTPERAGAQERDDEVLVFFLGGIPSVGLTHGQTLRVSVSNTVARLDDRAPTETLSLNFVRFRLSDAQGNVIAQSGEIAIPPAQFRSFNFNRSELPFAGEPGTGRLQVRLQIEASFTARQPLRNAPNLSPASLELVDNNTGKTAVALLLPAVQAAREAAR
ncbi:MAG: hypothetical protein ACR2GW_15040 [Pyrinomonadaceae bacterium]